MDLHQKQVGITEIVSDDRLLHFKPSNLISVSPTTPSNDFHVSRSLAKSPLRCSCVVVFELELALVYFKLANNLRYDVINLTRSSSNKFK